MRGEAGIWKVAMSQLKEGLEDMHVLMRNDGTHESEFHSIVLLMPAWKLMCKLMNKQDALEPTGGFVAIPLRR